MPSVLWRCWLGGRKGIQPVKKLSRGVLVWLFVWSDVQICIWPSWCHCHSLSLASEKIQIGFTFLVPAHPWVVPEKGPFNGYVFLYFSTTRCIVHRCISVAVQMRQVCGCSCYCLERMTVRWLSARLIRSWRRQTTAAIKLTPSTERHYVANISSARDTHTAVSWHRKDQARNAFMTRSV